MYRQNDDFRTLKGVFSEKEKDEITIRSGAAEYLTYVASIGVEQDSIEMRYEDENIRMIQKIMAILRQVTLLPRKDG